MGEFAGLFGWVIVVCYGLAVLNYVLKFLNREFGAVIRSNEGVKKYFNMVLKLIVRYHKVFGFLTALFIIVHFSIVYFTVGIKVTGIIVAILMLIQIIHGIDGTKMKKRPKMWLYSHRIIPILIALAIVIHIL